MNQEGIPKVFISYSWSSQAHMTWVLELSEKLMSDGINVILDKWDLKEGQDIYHFMEQMVNDPSITRVLTIFDKKYTEKANERTGGVGSETLIITPEIYSKFNQEKFIPIVRELDENGIPYAPAYAKNRKFINFTSDDTFLDEYEMLLRNIYNKPLHKKPILGTPPNYILEEEPIQIKTYNKLQNLKNAIIKDNRYVKRFIQEYLDTLILSLDDFKIKYQGEEIFDDLFMKSIENFLPYRDNFVEFIEILYSSIATIEANNYLHSFLENIINLKNPSRELTQWNDIDYDNFRFIIYELFLYLITVLIKQKQFDSVNFFLSERYFSEISRGDNQNLFSYSIFSTELIGSLEKKKHRLELRWFSMIAKTFEDRATIKKYNFFALLQSDLLLFFRFALSNSKSDHFSDNPFVHWYPHLVKHAEMIRNGLELFLRAKSKKFFLVLKTILNIEDKTELISKWSLVREKYDTDRFFDLGRTNFEYLVNFNDLDTE